MPYPQIGQDPLNDNRKQESMDFIRSMIEDTIEYGVEEKQPIDQELYDIDIREIHEYMHLLMDDRDFKYKLATLREYMVTDINEFAQLCDYMSINGDVEFTPNTNIVFFLETSDYAITIIPIQLDRNTVNIYIESLDNSPEFIKDMWGKAVINTDNRIKKKKKTIQDLKDEGKFVKF